MDLENIWQQAGGDDEVLDDLLHQQNIDKLQSKLPLKKLKYNLVFGIVCAAVITLFYVGLFIYVHLWQVQLALIVVMAFNVWTMVITWQLYKTIQDTITPSNSLKQELQKNYDGFQQWWAVQQKLGLFVYPIAATGGFILGGVLGSGKPVNDFLYNPKILLALLITLIILTPLCYYLARWMFRVSYGKYLKKLKALIDELN